MNIIQFKRSATDTIPTSGLQEGELFVKLGSEVLVIGKSSGTFEIKSHPSVGDIYSNGSTIGNTVITNVDVQTDDTTNVSTFKFFKNGSETDYINSPKGIQVEIKGKVSAATTADKLSTTNAGGDYQFIYFKNGVPRASEGTTNANKPVRLNGGKFVELSTISGLDSISATGISASNINATSYISTGGLILNNLTHSANTLLAFATAGGGTITKVASKGNESTPIYIDNTGAPRECSLNLSTIVFSNSSGISVPAGGSNMSSFGMENNGVYCILFTPGTIGSIIHTTIISPQAGKNTVSSTVSKIYEIWVDYSSIISCRQDSTTAVGMKIYKIYKIG